MWGAGLGGRDRISESTITELDRLELASTAVFFLFSTAQLNYQHSYVSGRTVRERLRFLWSWRVYEEHLVCIWRREGARSVLLSTLVSPMQVRAVSMAAEGGGEVLRGRLAICYCTIFACLFNGGHHSISIYIANPLDHGVYCNTMWGTPDAFWKDLSAYVYFWAI